MEVIEYSMNELKDPTGILSGERYEFRLYIKLEEDDELYSESGTGIRAIYAVEDGVERVTSAHFFERATDKLLNFELEEDEEKAVFEFCKEHLED